MKTVDNNQSDEDEDQINDNIFRKVKLLHRRFTKHEKYLLQMNSSIQLLSLIHI